MVTKKLLPALITICLFSFTMADNKVFEFNYPKQNGTSISLIAGQFKKFSSHWQDSDYYYSAQKNGFGCSVLYFKLNYPEKVSLAAMQKDSTGIPVLSADYAYTYFKTYSPLKAMEQNDSSWGKPTDDFMYRQNNVIVAGSTQKHMYAYCMVGDDIFVNIHLSKTGCTPADSLELMGILRSIAKSK